MSDDAESQQGALVVRLQRERDAALDALARAREKVEQGRAERRAAALAKYPPVLAVLKGVAYEHGYALAMHGSEARDLDVIAVPWVDKASDPYVLAAALALAVEGVILNDPKAQPGDWTRCNPEPKPHGRLAWSIQLGGSLYVDLSVMPRDASVCERQARYAALSLAAAPLLDVFRAGLRWRAAVERLDGVVEAEIALARAIARAEAAGVLPAEVEHEL